MTGRSIPVSSLMILSVSALLPVVMRRRTPVPFGPVDSPASVSDLPGHGPGGIDDGDVGAGPGGDEVTKKRIVGATENQGVGPRLEDRVEVMSDRGLGHRSRCHPGFHQVGPARTCLVDDRDSVGEPADHRGEQLALEGGRGGQHSDHFAPRQSGRRFHGRFHADERHPRMDRREDDGGRRPRRCCRQPR